jgi:hypothetical protein
VCRTGEKLPYRIPLSLEKLNPRRAPCAAQGRRKAPGNRQLRDRRTPMSWRTCTASTHVPITRSRAPQ